jgi:hypothetical protein
MVKGLVVSFAAVTAILVLAFVVISIWTVMFDNPGTA